MEKKLSIGQILLILGIVVMVLVTLYSGVRIAEKFIKNDVTQEPVNNSKVIVRDGVSYYPRQDILVMLVAGIDERGPVHSSGAYNNPGEADMVTLVIMDKTNRTIDMLALNRDTMVEMPILGVDGKNAGTYFGQLALAHTYGTGLSDSAENLEKTVSDLLYGLDIQYYVNMNMDAIGLLNDAVGGVTVTVTDDFSEVDPTIGMGEVKLNGDQALSYLRSRQLVGDQLNLTRMERQNEYMSAFVTELHKCLEEDKTFARTAYDEVDEYMVTDISSSALMGLVEYYSNYEMGTIYTLKGENRVGEYMEYYLDEQALDEMILKLFYAPIQ